ncbi:MAG: CRISPR-associated endonuclease Cas2 [Gammaproteobacteria bacterium]
MFVVVSYDIADDRRRTQVASEMENFGRRVQYSVFECHLSEAEITDLESRLQAIIDWDRDRVRYYRLCERDARRIVVDGPGEVSRDWDYLII